MSLSVRLAFAGELTAAAALAEDRRRPPLVICGHSWRSGWVCTRASCDNTVRSSAACTLDFDWRPGIWRPCELTDGQDRVRIGCQRCASESGGHETHCSPPAE